MRAGAALAVAAGLATGLVACSSAPRIEDCEPAGRIRPVCSLQNPEDLAELPWTPWRLVSQMNQKGTGSLLADLTGDGQLENAFIRNGILYIFSGNKRLYKSVKKMGGTLSFLTYDVDPSFQEPKHTTAAFEISPVAADVNADGRKELLASASERSILGSLRISSGLTKTYVSILKYDNGLFSSGTLGEEFEMALQGITFNQQRLLLVATELGDLYSKGYKSHLLAYSLAP